MTDSDEKVRVTATLAKAQETALRELAERNKVSVAWLVRHAVGRLLEENKNPQLTFSMFRGEM